MTESLKFNFEWVEPADAQGEELRATWARLLILVGEKRVTLNIDEKIHSARENVYLPLYPIAEWMACNWWVLINEPFNSKRVSFRKYWARHSLVGSGEGFAIPDLRFEADGEQVRLVWTTRRHPWAQLRFVEEGSTTLPKRDVELAFTELIEAVIRRLEDADIKDTFLQQEWATLMALDVEESKFCTAAGKLGRDPFNLSVTESRLIESAFADWGEETLWEVLAAVDPHQLQNSFTALRDVQKKMLRHATRFTKLAEFKERHMSPILWGRHDPWQIGYEYAQELRTWLGGANSFVSARKYDRILGLSSEPSSSRRAVEPFRGIDAIVAHSHGRFAIGVSEHHEAHWRFAHYRALFEILVTPASSSIALVSAAHSARQKANRAFAAEFLAPAEMLRAYFSRATPTEASIVSVAEKLGVSEFLVRHQLINHRIIAAEDLSWISFERPFSGSWPHL